MERATYAADPNKARPREFRVPAMGGEAGASDAIKRGPRSEYQRDRDRIIHSMSFRRLRSKTQVFIAPEGDHYRTRMTHSLEVAQIGRVIARALGLDEDLTEALCLAHDLGHPPFGHAGEEALEAALEGHGGFCHNAHALRTVMRIESPYPTHDGLNLTWDLLEGLAKHNGPVSELTWALDELDRDFSFELESWPSLEAQVAAIADDIAYDNHDIDDGLRAGFLTLDNLLELDFVKDQWRAVEKSYPNAPRDRLLRELVRGQIGLMVNDVIAHTRAQIKGIQTIEEVRSAERQLSGFSSGMAQEERVLKSFMYERLYYHPEQVEAADKAREVVAALFAAYVENPQIMPQEWRDKLPSDNPKRARVIADFLAGMSDRFAIEQYRALHGEIPAGLSNV